MWHVYSFEYETPDLYIYVLHHQIILEVDLFENKIYYIGLSQTLKLWKEKAFIAPRQNPLKNTHFPKSTFISVF